MLASDAPVSRTSTWQQILARSLTSPRELLARLGISPDTVELPLAERLDFPLRVPEPYLQRMVPGEPSDPLLLQVLPLALEEVEVPGFVADPLVELEAAPAPGLIHKYRGRVLLVSTGACAVHCRYCFRRHFPYSELSASGAELTAALDHIRGDDSIREVILSGGDPLVLSDRQLHALVREIETIGHVTRLRIHTRTPVVLPQRITDDLVAMLETSRLQVVMVLHANHAQEIDEEHSAALAPLADAGITLLNQSVLLRGVNDSVETLAELSERLFGARVLPYYLHLLDPVAGAAHFEVGEARAGELYRGLQAELPGYLLPRLVREVSGEASKTLRINS